MWAFSFLSTDSTPWSLCTSWYAHRNSSSRRSLNLMASPSWPSREERISFSSLRRGSLMSRLLATLLATSPPVLLHCPLILCVGTSFPCMRVMDDVGWVETVELKPDGLGRLQLLSRRRATSRARQRASLPWSAERRSSTSSLRAATSSGEERRGDCKTCSESETQSLLI